MKQSPSVGFVSLGCPKNLVDSERILTQLRAEGYEISPDYAGADLVIVNTCGFIDDAVEESLETIGEALEENGRVIVTGCLGVREDEIRETHPAVLAVTGPHAYEEVMEHVHEHLPAPHDPFLSLLPPSGVKLTPKHYAYLKISEGCNHRCSFCIIPQMRGDLVSRPFAEVMHEAKTSLPPVFENCLLSPRTPAPMAWIPGTGPISGRAGLSRHGSVHWRANWAISRPGSGCTMSIPIHTWMIWCR
jgi:ribosomal protein S12 methylthiotransferase